MKHFVLFVFFNLLIHGNAFGAVDFWLTILHNDDSESQLIDAGPGLEDFGGVARFATPQSCNPGSIHMGTCGLKIRACRR